MKPTPPSCAPLALVVDDEPLLRMDTADLLHDAGFAVIEAGHAAAAVALLQQHAMVTLLFTDVQMPGTMNGFALARAVAVRWPDTAVIVCSGHQRPKADEMPHGARFIDKPFTTKLMRDVVAGLGLLPSQQ